MASRVVGLSRGASGWRCEARMYWGMKRTNSRPPCSVKPGTL